MDSERTIIRYDQLEPRPWKNAAGITREIAREGSDDDWRWRVSIAEVIAEAPFSSFPGVDRVLVLLEGEGIELDFEDGRTFEVLPPFGHIRFEGEAALIGKPKDGATRDFNLMWQRAHLDAKFEVRPLVGSLVLFASADETWILHLAAGSVRLLDSDETLSRGDTLVVGGNTRSKLRLEGSGTAFLIRLSPSIGG